MKWLKDNWFKIAILILLAGGVALLFVYLDKRLESERQQELNNLSSDCRKLASQKKDELLRDDEELMIGNVFEYKYSPDHKACILAFNANRTGGTFTANLLGIIHFEVDNLSTGEVLLSEDVNPGDEYREANEKFIQLRKEYIGVEAK